MKNNICVFTGSRSEFGIYKILIDKLNKSKINFSLVVSGSHLSNNFGKTYDEIKKYKVKKISKIKLKNLSRILHHNIISESF